MSADAGGQQQIFMADGVECAEFAEDAGSAGHRLNPNARRKSLRRLGY
jgi:hypothetical protein